MNKYHAEISDDYVTEFEAASDAAARRWAVQKANGHGGIVIVFPGPIRSGVSSLFTVSPCYR